MSTPRYTRVGIVGAGQLGRMLALAGYPLGLRCEFLDRDADTPGAQVGTSLFGELDDPARLADLAARNDVLTFDWENIPAAALAPLRRLTRVRPAPNVLRVSQDRLREKALFTSLGIPVAAHAAVDRQVHLERAVRQLGVPGILKTRRLGYDGKGQVVIRNAADTAAAWQTLAGAPLIYEAFQRFTREVSLVAARGIGGEIVHYPLSANTHAGGILRYGVAPYVHPALERSARRYMDRVLASLNYVGVLAIEFFVVGGRLVANEMAPRVHNTGHWTIEGCVTSQFENHLRAICAMPLGSTRALGATVMVNFLGTLPERERLLEIAGLAYHDYGKTPRPGRKLGHCTVLCNSAAERNRALRRLLSLIKWT